MPEAWSRSRCKRDPLTRRRPLIEERPELGLAVAEIREQRPRVGAERWRRAIGRPIIVAAEGADGVAVGGARRCWPGTFLPAS